MAHGKVYSFRRKTLSIPCILSILIYLFPESSLCSWKIYSGMMIKVMIIVHFFPFSSIPRTIYLSTSMTSSVYSFWCLIEMTPCDDSFDDSISFFLVSPLDDFFDDSVGLSFISMVSPCLYSFWCHLYFILLVSPCLYSFWCHL